MPLFLFIFHIFIAYIHLFDHIHTIHLSVAICRGLSPSPHRFISSVGRPSLWCRAENRTRACLTASRRATNWATPHHKSTVKCHWCIFFKISKTFLFLRFWLDFFTQCTYKHLKTDYEQKYLDFGPKVPLRSPPQYIVQCIQYHICTVFTVQQKTTIQYW